MEKPNEIPATQFVQLSEYEKYVVSKLIELGNQLKVLEESLNKVREQLNKE